MLFQILLALESEVVSIPRDSDAFISSHSGRELSSLGSFNGGLLI